MRLFSVRQSRARGAMTVGAGVFLVGAAASIASLTMWKAGGYAVLFYGAVIAGIVEFSRGWSIRPRRPDLLETDD
jgi:hypothetical protein